MKKQMIFLLTLALAVQVSAQFSKVGSSAAQFLKFPADPKTAALGGAMMGSHGDVAAIFWNPAAIASVKGVSTNFSYASLYAGISYNFVGAAIAMSDQSAVGIHAFYLDSGEMEQTTIERQSGTGAFFSVKNYALGITYSRYLTEWLMTGLSVKYLREEIWHESAQSVAIDIGSVLETGLYGLRLGISIENFGTEMQMLGDDLKYTYLTDRVSIDRGTALTTESWPIPLTFRMGIAIDVLGGENQILENDQHQVTVLADYNEPNDVNPRGNFGLQYEWDKTVAARFGYYYEYDALQFSYGLGFKFTLSGLNLATDYALIDYGTLGYVNMYSLGLQF